MYLELIKSRSWFIYFTHTKLIRTPKLLTKQDHLRMNVAPDLNNLGLSQALISSQGAALYSALVAIMHFGDLSPKRGMSQIISITQNYIIAK